MNVKLIGDQDAKPGGRFDTPNLQHTAKSLGRTDSRDGSQRVGFCLLTVSIEINKT